MSRTVALALVVASGLGLLVVGLVALWRTARDAERMLELDAREGAEATARMLRKALDDPSAIERMPAAARFLVQGGRVVVPADLRWIDAPPEPAPESWRVEVVLRDAAAKEFAGGDRAAARARLEQGLHGSPDSGEPEASPLWLALGWLADRDRDSATRASALAHAERRDVAGWILLAAKSGAALPEWSRDALSDLDVARGEALLARVSELRPDLDVRALGGLWRERNTLRAELRRAAAAWPKTTLAGDELVLSHDAGNGNGQGAVVTVESFCAEVRATSPVPTQGLVVRDPEALARASAVIQGQLGVLAVPALLPSALGGPFGLSALLIALTLAFGGGTFVVLRALRREARATSARAEFLTSVTHELKTPLAGIRLLAERLDEGRVPDAGRRAEYHRLIAGETMRLSSLIENVLDLGRMERGERAYDRREHDLVEIVRGVVELFDVVAGRAGLVIELSAAGDPIPVHADRGALAQALLNVLDNARKYAPEGRRIDVGVDRENGHARLVVRDLGPGVPAGEREAIFVRFHRGGSHEDGAIPGLGLGLHLARTIARAHDGDLTCVAPRDGGAGAEFEFTFPCSRP